MLQVLESLTVYSAVILLLYFRSEECLLIFRINSVNRKRHEQQNFQKEKKSKSAVNNRSVTSWSALFIGSDVTYSHSDSPSFSLHVSLPPLSIHTSLHQSDRPANHWDQWLGVDLPKWSHTSLTSLRPPSKPPLPPSSSPFIRPFRQYAYPSAQPSIAASKASQCTHTYTHTHGWGGRQAR